MNLILDTNALSAFAEGDASAAARIADSDKRAVPVIVLGEYRFGILQSRFRAQYEEWLETGLGGFLSLPVDEDTATYYAEIRLELKRRGNPIPPNDVWIAALARQHDFTVLSRDRHFDRVEGLRRIGW